MPAKVLQDAKSALEGLNTDKIIEIYSDNFLFEDTSSKEQITDRSSLRKYFQQLFSLPKVTFSDIRIFEAESFAVIEWIWGGVKRSNGEPFRVRGASVIELSEGKVSRESIYYDPKSAWS
jgi:ketosteroid isomerase-like protein